MKLRSILLVGALALASCANLTGQPLVTSPSASTLLLQGDTALDAAWNEAMKQWIAYGPTASDAVKAKVRPLIPRGYALVQAANAGQLLTGEVSLTAEINDAKGIIAGITAAASGK